VTVNEDSTSFDVIYRDYYARIQRYLARLIGCDEAEDVTQEAFLRIARSLDGFRGESTVLTWVYRIATNVAMDRVRTPAYRASLNSVLLDESCETGESVAPVEDQAIRSEMSECVQGLVAQLPDHFRTVLVLSEMEDMKNSEIAQVLGVSLETVKIRLHRARTRLKAILEANCSFYHDPCNTLLCDIKTPPLD
jgi:RNA polymerase sigma-70 factor (ECF subfamily)